MKREIVVLASAPSSAAVFTRKRGSFDAALDEAEQRVTDRGGSVEVIEVEVIRRVVVAPVVTRIDRRVVKP